MTKQLEPKDYLGMFLESPPGEPKAFFARGFVRRWRECQSASKTLKQFGKLLHSTNS